MLSRELAYVHPTSHALLRAMELEGEGRPHTHSEAFLARRTGLPLSEVKTMLRLLADAGQVKKTRRGWVVQAVSIVDTGADPRRSRALKLSWGKLALSRLEGDAPGYAGYSVFAISREDLRRLREVHLAYVREMHSIISASRKNECVGLYCAQLLDLAHSKDNVFRDVSAPIGPRSGPAVASSHSRS